MFFCILKALHFSNIQLKFNFEISLENNIECLSIDKNSYSYICKNLNAIDEDNYPFFDETLNIIDEDNYSFFGKTLNSTFSNLNSKFRPQPTGTFILELLNSLDEQKKIYEDFYKKASNLQYFTLDQYSYYIADFFEKLLEISPYYVLFINNFINNYLPDIYDTEGSGLEDYINSNNKEEKKKILSDFYLFSFKDLEEKLLSCIGQFFNFVKFNDNDNKKSKLQKFFSIPTNTFEELVTLNESSIGEARITFKRKENLSGNKYFKRDYVRIYNFKISNLDYMYIAFYSLFSYISLKPCKDSDCHKFIFAYKNQKYCSAFCKKANLRTRKRGEILAKNNDLLKINKSICSLFDYKCNKASGNALKNIKKKKEIFNKRYSNLTKELKLDGYSIKAINQCQEYLNNIHDNLLKCTTATQVTKLKISPFSIAKKCATKKG